MVRNKKRGVQRKGWPFSQPGHSVVIYAAEPFATSSFWLGVEIGGLPRISWPEKKD